MSLCKASLPRVLGTQTQIITLSRPCILPLKPLLQLRQVVPISTEVFVYTMARNLKTGLGKPPLEGQVANILGLAVPVTSPQLCCCEVKAALHKAHTSAAVLCTKIRTRQGWAPPAMVPQAQTQDKVKISEKSEYQRDVYALTLKSEGTGGQNEIVRRE